MKHLKSIDGSTVGILMIALGFCVQLLSHFVLYLHNFVVALGFVFVVAGVAIWVRNQKKC